MSKLIRLCIIYALILSPAWFGLITPHHVPSASEGNLTLEFAEIVGIVIIGVVGVIFSALIRKHAKANTLSVFGYLVPAIGVCSYVLIRSL